MAFPPGLGAVLVFELARGDLFERDREVVPIVADVHNRGRVLAEATLAEVVEVAVDLSRSLGRDDHCGVVRIGVLEECVDAWMDHSDGESRDIPSSARTIPSRSSAARPRSSLTTRWANSSWAASSC